MLSQRKTMKWTQHSYRHSQERTSGTASESGEDDGTRVLTVRGSTLGRISGDVFFVMIWRISKAFTVFLDHSSYTRPGPTSYIAWLLCSSGFLPGPRPSRTLCWAFCCLSIMYGHSKPNVRDIFMQLLRVLSWTSSLEVSLPSTPAWEDSSTATSSARSPCCSLWGFVLLCLGVLPSQKDKNPALLAVQGLQIIASMLPFIVVYTRKVSSMPATCNRDYNCKSIHLFF